MIVAYIEVEFPTASEMDRDYLEARLDALCANGTISDAVSASGLDADSIRVVSERTLRLRLFWGG